MARPGRLIWPPTDLALLEEIYRRYHSEFTTYDKASRSREAKIYVPIDCLAVAKHFKIDPDIVFGRLYSPLERRFGLTNKDGSTTPFFARSVGTDVNAINFPMLAGIIAELRAERARFHSGLWVGGLAVLISVASLAVSILKP